MIRLIDFIKNLFKDSRDEIACLEAFDRWNYPNIIEGDDIRAQFINIRKQCGFKPTDFEGIMSRQTLNRFESGGDITLSKICAAVKKMEKRITIWM